MSGYDWSTEQTEPVEARIRRDRWSRYLIPHPDTGKEQAWTRATTLAGTLADRYGLEQWAKRNVALGIGARHDLYALAASCTAEDRDELAKIVTQAEEAAKGKAGANAGTAMHRLTERADRGEPVQPGDPQLAADLTAYRTTMAAAGIRVARTPGGAAWIERVLVVPDIGVAGTCDRVCLAERWTLPRIADLKTAKDVLRYGMVEIALQLAIYAHATHWYDPGTNTLHPMPAIDQTTAVVMHLPVGQARCTLYEVDIAAGWQAVQLALDVRTWRKRKDLAEIIPAVTAPRLTVVRDDTLDRRLAWLRTRVTAIVAAGHGDELAAIWAQRLDIPTLKQGGLTDEAITVAAGFCAAVEMEHAMPFHDGDPVLEPADIPAATEPAPVAFDEDWTDWAESGRQLLAQFGDEAVARAVAECAQCADKRITETDYWHLEAVVQQATGPDGGVLRLDVDENGTWWYVRSAPDAADRLAALHGGRQHALTAAKAHAKALGLPAARSLANVAENPLLAALTATGTTPQPSNDAQKGS